MYGRSTGTLVLSLEEISSASDRDDVVSILRRLMARYELQSVAYLGVGVNKGATASDPYLAVTYSSEWVSRYKSKNYIEIDPVIRNGFRRVSPLDWEELGYLDPPLRTFFEEANEFGLGRQGLTIPIRGHCRDRGLLTITSNLTNREWAAEKLHYARDFQLLAAHVHEAVRRLGACMMRPPTRLSPRELECLQWTAEGKTAWECSVILGITERTVRCYLESVRHKLNASSNTHAVSIAYRSGVLFPPL